MHKQKRMRSRFNYTETIRFKQNEMKLIDGPYRQHCRVINIVNEHRSDARSVCFISAGTENISLISAEHLLIVLLLSCCRRGQERVTVASFTAAQWGAAAHISLLHFWFVAS